MGTVFSGYGWNVTRVSDANDLGSLSAAFQVFRNETERPTLVIVDSHIGYGAPDIVDTSAAHGEPLGTAEVKKAKASYGWPEDAKFLVPDGVYEHFAEGVGTRGAGLREAWMSLLSDYQHEHPDLAAELLAMQRRELPEGWDADIPTFDPDPAGVATRDSSGEVLNAIAPRVPWLIGGSADLAPSTKTRLTFAGAGDFEESSYGARHRGNGLDHRHRPLRPGRRRRSQGQLTDRYDQEGSLPERSPLWDGETIKLYADDRNAAALYDATGDRVDLAAHLLPK